jgi:lipopolysaccharide export system permease protein
MQLTENQKYMFITFYGGRTCEEMVEGNLNKRNYPEQHETFEKQTIFFELKGFNLEPTDEAIFKHDYQTMSVSKLYYSVDSLWTAHERRKKDFSSWLNQNTAFRLANPKRDLNMIDSAKNDNYNNELQLSKDSDNYSQLIESHSPAKKTTNLILELENTNKIRSYLESYKNDILDREKNIYKHESAIYQKFTLAIACLIFLFIGAPLGAIIRKGGFGLPVIVSIAFFLFYYVVSLIGKKFAEEGTLSTLQGMWLSTVLALPIGIFLTYKASNDSNLFDAKTIFDFLIKPFKLFISVFLSGKRGIGE